MFGLSHDTYLLLDAVVTIIGLIVLITRFKVHPFLALIIAAGFLGMPEVRPRKPAAMISARNGWTLNRVINTIRPIMVTTASSSR